MKRLTLELELTGYWHAGSGAGFGPNVDAAVIRSPGGLPFLPGRTLRGLLREGATLAADCGRLRPERVIELFGPPAREEERTGDTSRYGTCPGRLFFTDATLGADMEAWAGSGRNKPETRTMVGQLYREVSATALDEHGQARDKTLRRVEVAVPVILTAQVDGPEDDPAWADDIRLAASLVRQLGSHRHRGLGRVQLTAKEG